MSQETGMEQKLVAMYCRVSTDEQAHEGISLSEQESRLTSYCKSQGWDAPGVEWRLYIDDGYSGKNTDRPGLQSLLRDMTEMPVERLLVTKLDRLSRRLLDLLSLIELMEKTHTSLVSTSEAFDTATPSGRLTLQVLGAVAEFERERIRERVTENMIHAAKSGRWLSKPPYGYLLTDKALVLYAPEAEVVRKIYTLFTRERLGFLTIAQRLNQEGISSKEGKGWSGNSIKKILRNPAYIGTVVWNRKGSDPVKFEKAHEAIIDTQLYDQASARLQRYQKTSPKTAQETGPETARGRHLLSGILRCQSCHSKMHAGYSGWPVRKRVYRCSSRRTKGNCLGSAVDAKSAENALLDALCSALEPLPVREYEVYWQEGTGVLKEPIERRLNRLQAQENRLFSAYMAGVIDIEGWQEKKDGLEEQRLKWSKERDRLTHFDEVYKECVPAAKKVANSVQSAIATLSGEGLRVWVESFVEACTFVPGEKMEIWLKAHRSS